MAKHRSYSVEFKRQVVQDYLAGETLYGLAKQHDISRNLIRIWIAKHEAGALDSDTAAADMLAEYDARIAALERLVGKLALENEFLKGASRQARLPTSASISVIAGPMQHRDAASRRHYWREQRDWSGACRGLQPFRNTTIVVRPRP